MITKIIEKIKGDLNHTFNEIDNWFAKEAALLKYRPENLGWSNEQILDHIAITNYYLLILIQKAISKAIVKSNNINYLEEFKNYNFNIALLDEIGKHNSFIWNRPEHMEPNINPNLEEVKATIRQQLETCQSCLSSLKNGEGVLVKTMMSVNGIGKIDIYHYIYFLVQHAKRHITQMKNNETIFYNL